MFFKNKKLKNKKSEGKPNKLLIKLLIAENEKEYLIDNLSLLISSGMSVSRALRVIEKDIKSKFFRKIVKKIVFDIENGISVSQTLNSAGVFSDYAISLIRIGEESGRLAENFEVISKQEKKSRRFKGKVRSAMMYPVLVLGISVFLGVGIAWFILPRLASVFKSLDMELPLITRALIFFGDFLTNYGKIFVPSLLTGVVVLFYFIFYFPKTKFIGQKILINLPVLKQLVIETEVARFSFLLGILLESGVPIVSALNSLVKTTSIREYRKLFSMLKEQVSNGSSLQGAFRDYPKAEKLIPRTVQQMIFSGENSGSLSQTLKEIGNVYEEKVDITTKNLTVLLEPLMLLFVWFGVVSLALAVILPIYSLVGGLNEPKEVNNKQKPMESEIIENQTDEEQKAKDLESEENEIKEDLDEAILPKVKILETGLGFLNIREEPSLESETVGKALSGEEYGNIGQREDWYEIVYKEESELSNQSDQDITDDKAGWVFGEYVELLEIKEDNNLNDNED